MADGRKTPPHGMKKQPRPATLERDDDARDRESYEAKKRREREMSPHPGTVPTMVDVHDDDYTDRYEIGSDELKRHREERDPIDRTRHLEDRVDALKTQFVDMRGDFLEHKREFNDYRRDTQREFRSLSKEVGVVGSTVSNHDGRFDGIQELLGTVLAEVKLTREQQHMKVTTTIETDAAEKMADIEVTKERELSALEVKTAADLDRVKAKRDRRRTLYKEAGKITAWVLGGVSLLKILQMLGVHI